ncbi:hypothetical protein FA95DRAFT_1564290 [Auriscalpium vulgare]|uniref:Uncharacterized protein n=1 Tax=Auriscalpium vulgare TaxID=40419 RepID=A0ACB8REA8_9AGAM|nr:hypothetical protein FA95DRAFT_1564290 [Auriscalpium vulgare]
MWSRRGLGGHRGRFAVCRVLVEGVVVKAVLAAAHASAYAPTSRSYLKRQCESGENAGLVCWCTYYTYCLPAGFR